MSQKKLTDFMKKTTNNDKSKSSSNAQKIQPNETTKATTVEQLTIEEDKPFHPPKDFCFPKQKFGERQRSCQANWFKHFEWLHYDIR